MYLAYKGMAVGLAIASAIVWELVALGGCSISKSSPDYNWGGQSSVSPPDTVCVLAPRQWAVAGTVRAPERSPVVPRRKESDSQTGLPFSRPPSRDRTLEIHCENCQACFIAWYGTEEDADTETVDVEKCGLCGGDLFKRDDFKDCVLRLMVQVSARNVKHGNQRSG